MSMMMDIDIKIWGIVQGVGFRPFIFKIADEYGLKGCVSNEGGYVHVIATGKKEAVQSFIRDITLKKPVPSEIVRMDVNELHDGEKCRHFDHFNIIKSTQGSNHLVFLPPDLAICDQCVKELWDERDPRYLHPFISCMECGPRYSIIDAIPYDRDKTSMAEFEMCTFCRQQYESPHDRRHHAQTIACHHCGPVLSYKNNESQNQKENVSDAEVLDTEALQAAVAALMAGKIIAVKGIGGYHYACSPMDGQPVINLRKLKGREEKPFAVMFYDIQQLEKYCIVTEYEKKVLQSRERPIVLLERKASDISTEVYKSSRYLGAFLPYTPLHYLLLKETGPLIMTSANMSDEPIIIRDEDILAVKSPYLGAVLYNNRKIRVGMDDSVVKCYHDKTLFIRRARGYTPLPVFLGQEASNNKEVQVLACGGQLKSTFCLAKEGFAYMSQYLGDLGDEAGFSIYTRNLERMQQLLRIRPDSIACDLHPLYETTGYAEKLGPDVIKVQHHYAHIASVMAEMAGVAGKNLYESILGVAFDGTGYGTDGKIWGGEFMICTPDSFQRFGHLKYVPLLGGDTSIKEVWKTAYAYLYDAGIEDEIHDERWQIIKPAIDHGINTVSSSSMGRLFDAVSSILDIQHYAGYEGECAIKLENAAWEYYNKMKNKSVVYALTNGQNKVKAYGYSIQQGQEGCSVNISQGIREIVSDRNTGADVSLIAYRFHYTVAEMTVKMCEMMRKIYGINRVALSGGVFQNTILFEMVVNMLESINFEVYYNTMVPANDGGISLGQAFVAINSRSGKV